MPFYVEKKALNKTKKPNQKQQQQPTHTHTQKTAKYYIKI